MTNLLPAFRTYLEANDYAATSRRAYLLAVTAFLRWFEDENQAPFTPVRLTAIDLTAYRTQLQHDKSVATVNQAINALRQFCAWLVERGDLTTNPAERLKGVRLQAPLAPQALTAPQAHALLREAQASNQPQRDYAIVQLLLQTGLRLSECAALRLGDLMISERKGQVVVRAGKGNKHRSVPLNASARQALADYLALLLTTEEGQTLAATLVAVGAALTRQPVDCPLWRSTRVAGRSGPPALGERAMSRIIAALVADCARRGVVPDTTSAHTLRHTFATNYLKDYPGDLVGLAALLGHSSLETTRIYVQPTREDLERRLEGARLNAFG